ncbi:MAG: GWxTD domain-containing protein, partial [Bacteroidales bacterium]|nr:GWxTD domain-containing protein [Bacteroidales bacterium]
YELYSPEIDDTTNVNFNFIDQQRFILPGGNYDLELLISDKHAETKAFSIVQPITIFFPEEKVSISGIELVDSYTQTSEENILSKSGYDLIPYLFNYFPENLNEIIFYTEIYNTEKMLGANEKFLLSYYIESFETDKKISKLVRFRRETTKAVVVLLNKFDISELASGNYNLVIEVIDRQNMVLASNTIFFQRNNPKVQFALSDITALNLNNTFAERITNADTLDEYIRMLEPISDEIESIFASTQLERSNLNTKQQYFMNFWLNRDNINPELAWFNYYKEVKKADNAFSTQIKKGYESDRGRVYLKYGPPNTINESKYEPRSYPYEIWHYYTLINQRNKKFVFYNPNYVANDYQLLHSDAYGEISDYKWKIKLMARDTDPFNIFNVDIENERTRTYGSQVDDYFDNPR